MFILAIYRLPLLAVVTSKSSVEEGSNWIEKLQKIKKEKEKSLLCKGFDSTFLLVQKRSHNSSSLPAFLPCVLSPISF